MKRETLLQSAGIAVAGLALSTMAAQAATETVLYSFPYNSYPYGRLEQDGSGALYGTAATLSADGAVYRLRQQGGAWTFKNLFKFSGSDGRQPYAGLIADRANAIFYGVAELGGTNDVGTVFSLASSGSGWTESVLHDFDGSDGTSPLAPLYRDKTTGNLFGTTVQGGPNNCGTVFEVTPSGGKRTFRTIYPLTGAEGCYPSTQLKPGPKPGTLIGTTTSAIFEMKQSHGLWYASVIHQFGGPKDGNTPSDLDEASDGTIYGVTIGGGGHHQAGIVFQLVPNHAQWTYRIISKFDGADGSGPMGINYDSNTGVLYGTTANGGGWNMGTVFKLAYNGTSWKRTVLHQFSGGTTDGAYPPSRPIVIDGVLYGTTLNGGENNGGVFYSVQP